MKSVEKDIEGRFVPATDITYLVEPYLGSVSG